MTERNAIKADNNVEEKEEKVKAKRGLPRGRVTVFPNWCKGCGLCVEFCPVGVLEQGLDGRVIVAHPEKCTACRWCELHCPDFAIFVADTGPKEEAE
jgi:2-oxoglutarate ferredoxin oxidoreductase subunit delta